MTGMLKAKATQNRRVMSFASELSSSVSAVAVLGSSTMPQMGQLPG